MTPNNVFALILLVYFFHLIASLHGDAFSSGPASSSRPNLDGKNQKHSRQLRGQFFFLHTEEHTAVVAAAAPLLTHDSATGYVRLLASRTKAKDSIANRGRRTESRQTPRPFTHRTRIHGDSSCRRHIQRRAAESGAPAALSPPLSTTSSSSSSTDSRC